MRVDRREFLALSAGLAAGCAAPAGKGGPLYRISLAEWSFHRALRAGEWTNLEFPSKARALGIEAVEYVNSFFEEKARDEPYLEELKRRADGEGVRSLLIMCDGDGDLGDPDASRRARAVENHVRWLEAARALGCHSIRVNAASAGTFEEQARLAADGLRRLAEKGGAFGLNVIVENHGGLSSHGGWLAGVIRAVGLPNCGTLPDFGNFRISGEESYDRYRGVEELMPFAKAVSAKSHEFDAEGREVHTDYLRMMRIVVGAGYRGFVGIEYEGSKHSEEEGVRLTNALLERVCEELS